MLRKFLQGLLAGGFLAAVTLFALAVFARPAAAATNPFQHYYFSFEQNLGRWTAAPSTGVTNQVVLERVSGDNGCPDLHGNYYALLKDAPAQAGTPVPMKAGAPLPLGTWMVAAFSAVGYSPVDVQYAARNAAQSTGSHPMVYIGDRLPTSATQFKVNSLALRNTWQQFEAKGAAGFPGGTIYVAIGFNSTNASIALDCISITIGKPGPVPVSVPNN